MDLFVYLVAHAGEVIPRDRLIRAVWPDSFVTDGALSYSMAQLRQVLPVEPVATFPDLTGEGGFGCTWLLDGRIVFAFGDLAVCSLFRPSEENPGN